MQKENARAFLRKMLGPAAEFRDGQWEAIDLAANRDFAGYAVNWLLDRPQLLEGRALPIGHTDRKSKTDTTVLLRRIQAPLSTRARKSCLTGICGRNATPYIDFHNPI